MTGVSSCRPSIAVVVIGRNEGSRLVRCLKSVSSSLVHDVSGTGPTEERRPRIIYVDSASTDRSREVAGSLGAEVLSLYSGSPTAARARNLGWRAVDSEYVLFLDGDTILRPGFVREALVALDRDSTVAAVWGHRRELHPERSIFNRVLDLDWIFPAGTTEYCGGDVLMRRSILACTGGYDDGLIAGEEPELCRRIRALGFKILHIDCPMTGHDLEMVNWRQYWRRATRAGYAYAEISDRYRESEDPMWLAESRGNLRRGVLWLSSLAVVLVSLTWVGWPLLLWISAACFVCLRSAYKARWKAPKSSLLLLFYGFHSQLQHIPILVGQIQWQRSRRSGRAHGLIEYKGPRQK